MLNVVHKLNDLLRSYIYRIACLILLAFISMLFVSNGTTYATDIDYSVYVRPSLNLSISTGTVSLNLNPAVEEFKSGNLNVSVATNNSYGYKLYINSSSSNLVKTDDDTKYIETLSSVTPESSFPVNKWGYKLSTETNYKPYQTNDLISESAVATNEISTTLNFGAKADYDTPAGTYELDLNFKALPLVTTNYIQNLDPELCTKNPMVVIDSRDQQAYTIQRLEDNNCWMMTNLNLGATNLTTDLTSSNTNLSNTITAGTFNSWRKASGAQTYTAEEYIPVSGTDATSKDAYGTLYNYCVASAGTICTDSNSDNAGFDICPAGWRLPTGGLGGEFSVLYSNSAYNTNTKMRNPVLSRGAAFALAGNFGSGTPGGQGSNSFYWSSTRNDNISMHNLSLNTGSVNPTNYYDRHNGGSIRCIRDTSTIADVSNMQDITHIMANNTANGVSKSLTDTRDNNTYTVTKINGSLWMTDNLTLGKDSSIPAAGSKYPEVTLTTNDSDVTTTRILSAYDIINEGSNNGNCWGIFNSSAPADATGLGYTTQCMHTGTNSYLSEPTVWYNYAAATAGTIANTPSDAPNLPATESICPKGWKLPSATDIDNTLDQVNAFNPVMGGYIMNTTNMHQDYGYWWSSDMGQNQQATHRYQMYYINNTTPMVKYQGRRYSGEYVRCVAK